MLVINLFRIPADFYIAFVSILVLLVLDFSEERFSLSLQLRKLPLVAKITLLVLFVSAILLFGVWNEADFLYFQF